MVTLSEPFPVLQHVQSSYRHFWFTLQTEFESFNQGNFSQIKTGRTKALLDSLSLTSILEWNGQDDSTNTLKLEAAAIFGLLCILEASKPESRAIPEELKDNTSNKVLEGDFTQEPKAFTISQDDELDKASQSLSIDAKPNRKKSSGPVISKLKKLILNHYQPSII
ncbi:hypothetical protein PPACK8108_LOCUS20729 [Phakopsora pachyrhizi]|uniref:Uncharacterized protein n=1 Tax=Phakopsora pachyrhizi TaxID=170000 RepID=A0AAV0BHU7_PHAPC|nr:hypothetical protein PPACK8108_LOCUS20729 [Phakopsora pachyrhizi]